MLNVSVPETEFFDELSQEFVKTRAYVLTLEHSLVSLSKWESKWKKPFLDKRQERTSEEILDYIRCMTITQNIPDECYKVIASRPEIVKQITEYINDPMTATTINSLSSQKENQRGRSKPIITSEIIYYWMITYNVPVEFQKWHLNRLLTLIKVCEMKNSPPKKMPRSAIHARNRQLNAQRRARLNSSG